MWSGFIFYSSLSGLSFVWLGWSGVKNFFASASFSSCCSCARLQYSINIKNNKAPKPKRMVQVKPHKAPAVKAKAMQTAERMVKSILNFKSIIIPCAAAVITVRGARTAKNAPLYIIYIILYTRARVMSRENGARFSKTEWKDFYKKVENSWKSVKKRLTKGKDSGNIYKLSRTERAKTKT